MRTRDIMTVRAGRSTSRTGGAATNRRILRTVLGGGAVLALLTGGAWAADVILPGAPPVVVQPPAPPVVVQPPPTVPGSVVIVEPNAVPQTIQADTIKANQVRAQAIYANKIKARDVQGVVHQAKTIDGGNGKHDVKAPLVSASVIYADEIKADSVIANDIYVRKLTRD